MNKLRKSFWSVVGPLLVAGLSSCSNVDPPKPPPPPTVVVAAPGKADVTDFAYYTGVAHASESAKIRARVQGFLRVKHFKEGAIVAADDPLFTIEKEPFLAELEQPAARISQAEAAVALANANYDRGVPLSKTGAVTQQELQTLAAKKLTPSGTQRTSISATRPPLPWMQRIPGPVPASAQVLSAHYRHSWVLRKCTTSTSSVAFTR